MTTELSVRIAEILLETKSVKVDTENLITYTSGIKAPIYCDNRRLISFPKERQVIVDAMEVIVSSLGPVDCFAGTSTAGIPWAAFLAQVMQKPMVYVRSKPKGHGGGKQVEGVMEKGAKVVVVEDLFSTGGSSLNTVAALKRECDADVVKVLAIFQYGFTEMKEKFAEEGIDYQSLSSFAVLGDLLVAKGKLTDAQRAELTKFMNDPWGWRG